MAAHLLRRPTRLFVVLGVIGIFYVLLVFIPGQQKQQDSLWAFNNYVQSTYNWSALEGKHPVANFTPLPAGTPRRLPRIQYDFASAPKPNRTRRAVLAGRRAEVKASFVKTWKSYKNYAWMYDELEPVSAVGKDTFGGWAATLVDSLDTLWIMGLKDEFYEAAAAAVTINWETRETSVNMFETTIRHLGGLLSAYDLSKERALLHKAVELGDMLYAGFDTPNRMPPFWLDFTRAKEGSLRAGNHDPSASLTSSGLEFTRLAQLTGDDKYYDAIDRVARFLERSQNKTRLPGMWPTFFNLEYQDVTMQTEFTVGALADSLYEYLPKMYALVGGLEPMYESMYRTAMDTISRNLLFRPMLPGQDDILFTGDVSTRSGVPVLRAEGQHLSCFAGGMYALGGRLFDIPEHVAVGGRIARGCAWMYAATPTGVMPEIFNLLACPDLAPCAWDEGRWQAASRAGNLTARGVADARDPRYLLRPEALESLFLLYRMTGDESYQELAWQMFRSIRAATETDLAFSAIQSVLANGTTTKLDSMESFWPAETLKYLWLIFSSPDLIDLDKYVLNTEAHPLLRPT